MKELFDLFTRLVIAVENIAASKQAAPGEAPKAEKPKKEKTEKPAETKSEEKPAPKKDPFKDDDEPAAPVVTKEQVRKALTDYANATDADTALAALTKATSNKAGRVPDIKAEEYPVVFEAISKLLEATKK